MIKNLLSKFTLKVFVEFGSYELKISIPQFSKLSTTLSAIALNKNRTRYQLVDEYYNPVIKKNLKLFYPFEGGVISDYHSAEILLRLSMEKLLKQLPLRNKLFGIDYYVSLHSNISEVQISAVTDILQSNGGNQITYIYESICAAKGIASLEDNNLITDRQVICLIGHSITEILAIEGTNVISQNLLKYGVRTMIQELKDFIINKYQATVATDIIHSTFFNQKRQDSYTVTGKSIQSGKPTNISISYTEFMAVVQNNIKPVVSSLDSITSSLPNRFTKTLKDTGVYLSGGASNIKGLREFIKKSIGLEVLLLEDTQKHVVTGLEKISQNENLLEELQIKDFVML